MFDLATFSLRDMTACGAELRKLATQAQNLDQVAEAVTRYLFEHLLDRRTGQRACALVRFFKSYPWAQLDPDLQAFARRLLGEQTASPDMKCLTLLASAGTEPAWNDRKQSLGHRAIPLPSAELVLRLPMIAQLLQQFGLEMQRFLQPQQDLLMDLEQTTYNVFHVPEALGSPFVPAQEEFVKRYGIRSVLGFGGMLPTGNLFAVILFTRVAIPRETAELFKPLALSTKLAVLPFVGATLPEPNDAGPSESLTP